MQLKCDRVLFIFIKRLSTINNKGINHSREQRRLPSLENEMSNPELERFPKIPALETEGRKGNMPFRNISLVVNLCRGITSKSLHSHQNVDRMNE